MGWFSKLSQAIGRLDRATNPLHKAVQDKITDKYFDGNQEKAWSTAHSVGISVLDYFFYGLGSALNATDQAQDKNYKGAVISAASAVAQGYAAGTSSASNAGGSGITTGGGGGVLGANTAADSFGSGITLSSNSAGIGGSIGEATAGSMAVSAGSSIYADSTVVGFDETTLGTGITLSEAEKVGAANLRVGDLRTGVKYIPKAVELYDKVTRSGDLIATYGKPMTQVTNFSLEFGSPQYLSAIPAVASADHSAQLAAAHLKEAQQAQQNKLIFAAVVGLYFLFK